MVEDLYKYKELYFANKFPVKINNYNDHLWCYEDEEDLSLLTSDLIEKRCEERKLMLSNNDDDDIFFQYRCERAIYLGYRCFDSSLANDALRRFECGQFNFKIEEGHRWKFCCSMTWTTTRTKNI